MSNKAVNDIATTQNDVLQAKGKENNFFIPKEQVIPDTKNQNLANPFNEADILNANLDKKNVSLNEEPQINSSLISKLSNVKEKAINVGTKAFSIASELANKSLETTKFSKKEENTGPVAHSEEEVENKTKIEPTFFSNDSDNLKTFSTNLQDSNKIEENITIPSFLRRNKD